MPSLLKRCGAFFPQLGCVTRAIPRSDDGRGRVDDLYFYCRSANGKLHGASSAYNAVTRFRITRPSTHTLAQKDPCWRACTHLSVNLKVITKFEIHKRASTAIHYLAGLLFSELIIKFERIKCILWPYVLILTKKFNTSHFYSPRERQSYSRFLLQIK